MPSSPFRFVVPLVLTLWILGSPVRGQAQIEELPRPDTAHARSFGVSVALEDSVAVVGASGESTCGPNSGAVYVYEREPRPGFDEWRGTVRLTPHDCQPNTFFGDQVALSGQRLLVSASSNEPFADEGANAAYVFRRTANGAWEQTARFTGSADHTEGSFGADIDLDGDRAVVSTSGSTDGRIGGAVYVYDYNANEQRWSQTARLTASRGVEAGVLGRSVAVHGNRLAVAASTYFDRDPGSVYVFERNTKTGQWRESTLLRGVNSFFIDLDLHGSVLLVGEERAGEDGIGRATVFTNDLGQGWTETASLRPSLPYESGSFGTDVSLNGPWALVTGYGEQLGKDFNIDRVVYVFRRRGGRSWHERTILDIGQVDFGAALGQDESRTIVSSVPEDAPGSAYVIQLH